MKIGIIVYSQTGQTLAIAQALHQKLTSAGQAASLEKLESTTPVKPGAKNVTLKTVPALDGYEAVVLAAPVWGGVPAPPMVDFLDKHPDLTGKRIIYLVTGFFPPNMGCNQAIAQIKTTCEAKGAISLGSGSLSRLTFGRKKKAKELVDDLAGLL